MAQIKNVTELDFDQIKTNLKVFLSAQEKFNDYDFDGAGLNVLLDILAYNTQYNALLAHMTTNETFLDSAQIRSNAVSHAKNLGYIPKSRLAATAKLKVTVTGDADSPATLTIPKGFSFTGQIGSNTYTFVTNGSYNATKNSFNNQYVFSSVEAKEGKLVNFTYRVDNSQELQKFRVADLNIDTSTILVRVRESLTSSDNTTYTLYDNLLNVNSDSNVYYLQENMNGQYEFYFGDNILGNKPTTGQIVELTYISTNGLEGNGAKSFSANSAIGGFTSISVELATGFAKTIDGADKETIDSIKFNAPKLFAAQNRAVTSEDYKTILNATYDFIQDISVWGGEVNDPPLYGKVFISINPVDSDFLTDSTKGAISTFLSNKNVGSVTTEIVDPDYTYITGAVLFKYNPNETNRTQTQLESAVRQAITDYNTTKLGKFDGVLRYSELLRTIDNVDAGILNSFARLEMHKHVTPVTNIA
jgi:major membrane immunogen (membrane-anchored lipoprotein)